MAKITLDAIDKKILEILQRDARILNTELADEVGLTPGPCLKRVKRLEAAGIISRYVTLLDREKIGQELLVFVAVTMDKQIKRNFDRFAEAMRKRPEVLECHLVLGESDFLLKVVAPDLNKFQTFLLTHISAADGVGKVVSTISIKPEKSSTVVPLLS
jgi:Lrp/AsnC family transcriptional regulator, leucine-responsive regulatory protein